MKKQLAFLVPVILSALPAFAAVDWFADLPSNAAPATVSRRVTDQFLRTRPEKYCPPGYRGNGYHDQGYGDGTFVQYAVCSLWANAIECARHVIDLRRTHDVRIRACDISGWRYSHPSGPQAVIAVRRFRAGLHGGSGLHSRACS